MLTTEFQNREKTKTCSMFDISRRSFMRSPNPWGPFWLPRFLIAIVGVDRSLLGLSEQIAEGAVPGIGERDDFGSSGRGCGIKRGYEVERAEARFASAVRGFGRGGLLAAKSFSVSRTASASDLGATGEGASDWTPTL
jgi:hypothetical protein